MDCKKTLEVGGILKYFVYSFTGFIIVLCLVFICVQFASGNIDSNSHFHLDVLIANANKSFESVKVTFNDSSTSYNFFIRFIFGDSIAKVISGDNLIYKFFDFAYNALSSLIGLIKALITIITTPCIY